MSEYEKEAIELIMLLKDIVERDGYLEKDAALMMLSVCASEIITKANVYKQLDHAWEHEGEYLAFDRGLQ